MIKLPEPVAWRFDRPGISKLDVWPHGGDWERLYTESQMRQAIRDALEEAAKAIEDDVFAFASAKVIRKLKEDV